MTRIRHCSVETISLMKKVLVYLIKDAFLSRFNHVARIRDLCLLPRLLGVRVNWQDVRLSELALALGVNFNDLDLVLMRPQLLHRDNVPHPPGKKLLDFRLHHQGSLPTRLKVLFSWNLNSWLTTSPMDYKIRRCRRLLRSGPICLQETKWQGHETEALYQSLPGVRIVQSPAIAFNNRIGTGGVAILFPPGWQVLEELELVLGRAIASLVQDRACQLYILSVYLHPDNRKKDAEDLLRAWRFLTKKTDKAFIAGDFNSLDKHFPKIWEKLLLQFEVTDVNLMAGQPTPP